MDNRRLYAALQANSQFKAMGVELLPACTPADVQIQITHNLEQTEDWIWQLNAADGHEFTSGRLVAFQGKEVAGKLARAALHQLAVTNGSAALAENQRSSQPLPAGKTVQAKWLPPDLEHHDTHVTLYFDSERVWAHDRSGALVFEFSADQFRDARLTREWWQPLALDDPTGLIDAIATPADAEGVMVYLGIGAVLAQVRIPWHSLELVWEKDGVIKTVALEISKRNGMQLINDLQNAAIAHEPSCDRALAGTIRSPQQADGK